MNYWGWNFDRNIWEQIQEYLEFITMEMEPLKKSWIKSQYEELSRYCAEDSPPEHIMLIQMLVCLHRHIHSKIVEIKPQAEIKLQDTVIRVDFFLVTKVGDFAVECHGKTHMVENVWRQDLKKSRSLSNAGITYIAFSSSEIFYGSSQCLCGEEIRSFIDTRIARRENWIRPETVLEIIKEHIHNDIGPALIEYLRAKRNHFKEGENKRERAESIF